MNCSNGHKSIDTNKGFTSSRTTDCFKMNMQRTGYIDDNVHKGFYLEMWIRSESFQPINDCSLFQNRNPISFQKNMFKSLEMKSVNTLRISIFDKEKNKCREVKSYDHYSKRNLPLTFRVAKESVKGGNFLKHLKRSLFRYHRGMTRLE